MRKRFVIVGNGGAAVSAAMAARSGGFAGEILMISDVDSPAYNPMLGPYYLKGSIPWERCFPFGSRFYRESGVTCLFGKAVETLDAERQEVAIAGGARLSYDYCLIATGANAIIPPVPGLRDSDRVFVLRSAESARRLESIAGASKKAIVLGASFVGLKVAEILKKRGIDIILLDVVGQLLPRGAHPATATMLQGYLEEKGIEIRLGCTLTGLEGDSDGVTCHFSDDILDEADFVVACTGVRANADFLDRDQVRIDQGIIVDDAMRTSVPTLYAAGDVCQATNFLSGAKECFGTWQTARLQGAVAGRNIAGIETRCRGSIQENISPFFDWQYAQVGDVQAVTEARTLLSFGDSKDGVFGLIALKEGIVAGFNLINCTQFAGELRKEVITRAAWHDREKLLMHLSNEWAGRPATFWSRFSRTSSFPRGISAPSTQQVTL